jgi:ferric-dicitrate binding protein FerR (iron transport regulator)
MDSGMFGKHEQPDRAACPPWPLLLRHVVQAKRLTRPERDFVVDHIGRCQRCYDIYSALSDAEATLWEEAAKAAGISGREVRFTRAPEEALADLWWRIDRDAAAQRRQRRRAQVFRVASLAAAACIVIATGVGRIAMRKGDSGPSRPRITANVGLPAVFAERATAEGREPLALDQPITAGAQPQEILLGGMHHVVMNCNTRAAFSAAPPRTEGPHAGKVPYEIRLAQGELYVEVVPGHPFTVRTANARLDISGTKFDVVTDGDKTELTLLKGSVRFSVLDRPREAVSVTAGHASTISGRSAPSTPRHTDAFALTAWARDLALANTIAPIRPDDDLPLGSIRTYWPQPKPLDLNSLNYEEWRDDHRGWFTREFPWIDKAQKALQSQYGIHADYIELLMVSGDIWQFHYPRAPEQPIPIFNAAALQQLAAHYGADLSGLLEVIGEKPADHKLAGESPAESLAASAQEYRAALQRWHADIVSFRQTTGRNQTIPKAGGDTDVLLFTLHAGVYLRNTRIAAWAWARAHSDRAEAIFTLWAQSGIAGTGRKSWTGQQWLNRLPEEARAADSVSRIIPDILVALRAVDCENQTYALSEDLLKNAAALQMHEGSLEE